MHTINKKLTTKQQQLVTENHNLIYSFLQKYNLSIDEYYDIAAIGLCKAGMTFNEDKANFSTYAYKCMYTSILGEIRDKNADKRIPEHQLLYYQNETENIDGYTATFLDFLPSNIDIEDEVFTKIIIDSTINSLKDKEITIFSLLLKGETQREVAKKVGYSQAHIARIKNKIVNRIKENI